DELENYTNIKYTEDGDSIPSIFERNFDLGYYDRDLVEKKWTGQTSVNNIQDLLQSFSFSDQFSEQFDNINLKKEFNTVILVYNFEYDARKTRITYKNNELECIGVAQYTVIVDDRW
ncbi:immunity 22 family protein, partial [Bacillus pseudomycoides]|uniref:immunity 22 family protein n=2 Tax=Bacillus TaxID=1386 RepID=UPI002FFD9181